MRSQLKPSIGSPEAFLRNPSPTENGWLIADRIATLREAFQNTPHWLGFNIELKYPTDAELAVMPTRFYSRNYFCDEVLRVRGPAVSEDNPTIAGLKSGPSQTGACQLLL